ncbi:MAG: hypothetical protein LC808_34155, partial [Actinobacteria bacterium]|nr:hypothetical protein [Actinomycetota bacterium]
ATPRAETPARPDDRNHLVARRIVEYRGTALEELSKSTMRSNRSRRHCLRPLPSWTRSGTPAGRVKVAALREKRRSARALLGTRKQ